MKNASLPIALIAVGVAWLLWHFRLFPDIDWLIAAALMAAGVAILLIDRFTRTSIVTGPFLIATGIAWMLHDRWHVTWFVLLPSLLVLLGVLMLIARMSNLPESRRGSVEKAG
jgi:ABC-type multidrug transport system fused ATPase/permease subunit